MHMFFESSFCFLHAPTANAELANNARNIEALRIKWSVRWYDQRWMIPSWPLQIHFMKNKMPSTSNKAEIIQAMDATRTNRRNWLGGWQQGRRNIIAGSIGWQKWHLDVIPGNRNLLQINCEVWPWHNMLHQQNLDYPQDKSTVKMQSTP